MRHLKSYKIFESNTSEVITYVKEILLDLKDDDYLVTVSKIPYINSFDVSIKKYMKSGYSVVKVSDILPTIQHIINYAKDNNFPHFLIKVQPLWYDSGHLKSILYSKLIKDNNKYGEIRLTFVDVNWVK